MSINPYKVLGIHDNASEEEIKKAYKAKIRQYHPDLYPNDPVALEKSKEINEAYDMLIKKKNKSNSSVSLEQMKKDAIAKVLNLKYITNHLKNLYISIIYSASTYKEVEETLNKAIAMDIKEEQNKEMKEYKRKIWEKICNLKYIYIDKYRVLLSSCNTISDMDKVYQAAKKESEKLCLKEMINEKINYIKSLVYIPTNDKQGYIEQVKSCQTTFDIENIVGVANRQEKLLEGIIKSKCQEYKDWLLAKYNLSNSQKRMVFCTLDSCYTIESLNQKKEELSSYFRVYFMLVQLPKKEQLQALKIVLCSEISEIVKNQLIASFIGDIKRPGQETVPLKKYNIEEGLFKEEILLKEKISNIEKIYKKEKILYK